MKESCGGERSVAKAGTDALEFVLKRVMIDLTHQGELCDVWPCSFVSRSEFVCDLTFPRALPSREEVQRGSGRVGPWAVDSTIFLLIYSPPRCGCHTKFKKAFLEPAKGTPES